jgi:hypothetical protein
VPHGDAHGFALQLARQPGHPDVGQAAFLKTSVIAGRRRTPGEGRALPAATPRLSSKTPPLAFSLGRQTNESQLSAFKAISRRARARAVRAWKESASHPFPVAREAGIEELSSSDDRLNGGHIVCPGSVILPELALGESNFGKLNDRTGSELA